MKDGDFDRLRILMGDGTGETTTVVADPDRDVDADGAVDLDEPQLGVAATPAQLAAGSAILAGLILVGLAALRRRNAGVRATDGER